MNFINDVSKDLGKNMHDLARRLFPICRSITGDGVRETFKILQEIIPLKIMEIPTGTRVFDWVIPDEWNINDAYVKNSKGERVIDFMKSNLHVVGYSEPFDGKLTLDQLKEHLHTMPDQPDLIPYVTSYYKRDWGFCLSHNKYKLLNDDLYEVKIDSSLKEGSLTMGELVIPGKSKKEILISTYICHPSMANNELSGPVLATFLADYILNQPEKPEYTFRFVFVPETIGAIAYLSMHKDYLKDRVIAGYVLTCVGDSGSFSYLKSRAGNTLVDRITLHVLKNSSEPYKEYDYLERGSDERQYCAPGIDLPVGSFMRTKYGEYPEYHTSADDLEFVTPEGFAGSFNMFLKCIYALENNHKYTTTVLCEPQMGARGLYPTTSKKGSTDEVKTTMDLLAYCDDQRDLLSIADKLNISIYDLIAISSKLEQHNLIKKI